ncbi:MAG TPA: plastocyanin/azurin family copper-binding protein [Gemmatimonadales bacterium]
MCILRPHRLAVALLCAAAPLAGQSLLYRSPNLTGTWVPEPAVVQFDFVHRFYVAPASSGHFVINYPTFTLATGLARGVSLGAWFGTHSLAGSRRGAVSSNETEVFARWRAWGAPEGTEGAHLAITPAYDFLARSADGELSLDYSRGALTLEGAARIMSRPLGDTTGARAALAGGAVVRLTRYVALSADVGSMLSPTVKAAWSAGLQFQIPGTPHTFALEVSTAQTSSIQGNSIGTVQTKKPLYGFEFTIPLHLGRFAPWFHPHRGDAAPAANQPPAAATVDVTSMHFAADTVTISAGQAVEWVNGDPLDHTITLDDGSMGSPLIHPGARFRYVFDHAGTFAYHCTPHPFMKGVVVVK